MSNWCHNVLDIHGPEKDIDEIYKRARFQIDKYSMSEYNIFYGLVDQDIFNSKASILNKLAGDCDTWNIILEHLAATVGVKGDDIANKLEDKYTVPAFDLTEERSADGILLTFDSSWAPSFLVMEYFIKKFPAISIKMTYEESGSHYYGLATYNTGNDDRRKYKYFDCSKSTCIENSDRIYDFVESCFDRASSMLSLADIKKKSTDFFKENGCDYCPLWDDKQKCKIMKTEFFDEAVMPEDYEQELEDAYKEYINRHSYTGYQKVRDENKLGKAMYRGKSLKTGEYIDGYKYEEYPYVCITKPGETYNNRVFIVYQVNMDWNLSTSNMEEVDPATVEPVTGYHGKTLSYYMNLPYSYTIEHIKEEDGGGIMLRVPLLKGCMTDGDTIEEAVQNLKDAKETWLAFAIERGAEIPEPEAIING